MTREQLVALRTVVALAEHHIRMGRRSKHRLEWTHALRSAKQALREVTHDWIAEDLEKEGK